MPSSAAPPPAATFASDLREVARVAVASRLCVVALAVLSDLLLPEHDLLRSHRAEATTVLVESYVNMCDQGNSG